MNDTDSRKNRSIWITTVVFVVLLTAMYAVVYPGPAIAAGCILVMGLVLLAVLKPSIAGFERVKEEAVRKEEILPLILRLYKLDKAGMKQKTIMVDRQDYTIGRSGECRGQLAGADCIMVSRVHATVRLETENGESYFTVIPQNTPNGTKLKGKTLQPGVPVRINTGDVLTLGDVDLLVEVSRRK